MTISAPLRPSDLSLNEGYFSRNDSLEYSRQPNITAIPVPSKRSSISPNNNYSIMHCKFESVTNTMYCEQTFCSIQTNWGHVWELTFIVLIDLIDSMLSNTSLCNITMLQMKLFESIMLLSTAQHWSALINIARLQIKFSNNLKL